MECISVASVLAIVWAISIEASRYCTSINDLESEKFDDLGWIKRKCESKPCGQDCEGVCQCKEDNTTVAEDCKLQEELKTVVQRVLENAEQGTEVISFPKSDIASWKVVSYSDSRMANYFTLRKQNGRYSLVVTTTPDLEDIFYNNNFDKTTFTLALGCSTGGERDKIYGDVAVQLVPVNEFPPSFMNTPIRGKVPEDTPPCTDLSPCSGKELLRLSDYTIDRDVTPGQSETAMTFKTWPRTDTFGMDGQPYLQMRDAAEGAIYLAQAVDFEQLLARDDLLMHLNVSATDNQGMTSFTTVEFTVTDVDDLPPEFNDSRCPEVNPKVRPCMVSYTATIPVSFTGEVTSIIPGPVSASDLDSLDYPVTYGLEAGPGLSLDILKKVHINSSGNIFVDEVFQIEVIGIRFQFTMIATEITPNGPGFWTQAPLTVLVTSPSSTPSTMTDVTRAVSPTVHNGTFSAEPAPPTHVNGSDLRVGGIRAASDSQSAQTDNNSIHPLLISTIVLGTIVLVGLGTSLFLTLKRHVRTRAEVHPSPPGEASHESGEMLLTASAQTRTDPTSSTRGPTTEQSVKEPLQDSDSVSEELGDSLSDEYNYGRTRNNNTLDGHHQAGRPPELRAPWAIIGSPYLEQKQLADHDPVTPTTDRRTPQTSFNTEKQYTYRSSLDSAMFPNQLSDDRDYGQQFSSDEKITAYFESNGSVVFQQRVGVHSQNIRHSERETLQNGDAKEQQPDADIKGCNKQVKILDGTYKVIKDSGSPDMMRVHHDAASSQQETQTYSTHLNGSMTREQRKPTGNQQSRFYQCQEQDRILLEKRPQTSCSTRRLKSARSGEARPSTAHLGARESRCRHSCRRPCRLEDGQQADSFLERISENFELKPVIKEIRYVVGQKPRSLSRKQQYPSMEQGTSPSPRKKIETKNNCDTSNFDPALLKNDQETYDQGGAGDLPMRTNYSNIKQFSIANKKQTNNSTDMDEIDANNISCSCFQKDELNTYNENHFRKQKSRISLHDSNLFENRKCRGEVQQTDSREQEKQASLRKIKIKTGVLKRLTNEYQCYKKETEDVQTKTNHLQQVEKDYYIVKKHLEILEESRSMIRDSYRRMWLAYDELKSLLRTNQGLVDTKEYRNAQVTLTFAEQYLELNIV